MENIDDVSSISIFLDSYIDILKRFVNESKFDLERLTNILQNIEMFSEENQTIFWRLLQEKHHMYKILLDALVSSLDITFVSRNLFSLLCHMMILYLVQILC
jgi:hypothetical protein